MTLTDYIRILVRRGWIVVLAMALTAGSAYLFSRLQTPVYRATQKILIVPARNDFGLAQTIKQVISSYVARWDAEERAREVLERLDRREGGQDTSVELSPGALNSAVTVSSDLNALLINIDVDLADGPTANRVANAYGQLFVQWREAENAPLRLEDRIKAELLDYPQYGQFRPNTTVNILAGALLGLIWGGALVFILEFLSANILRRAADVERFLGVPVLGALPDAE